MTTSVRCLGIVDWGIGGVHLFREIQKAMPKTPVIYLSDAGWEPYGLVPPKPLRSRIIRAVSALAQRGASHVVIACNAASTVLKDSTTDMVDSSPALPCLGVIRPTIAALECESHRNILLLGGRRTIDSGIYQNALTTNDRVVRAYVAQPLSALVERGAITGTKVRQAIIDLVPAHAATRDAPPLTLVPACTHYTALLPELERHLRPRQVVDPATETLRHAMRIWHFAPSVNNAGCIFLTTGDPERMRMAAETAFSTKIDQITALKLALD